MTRAERDSWLEQVAANQNMHRRRVEQAADLLDILSRIRHHIPLTALVRFLHAGGAAVASLAVRRGIVAQQDLDEENARWSKWLGHLLMLGRCGGLYVVSATIAAANWSTPEGPWAAVITTLPAWVVAGIWMVVLAQQFKAILPATLDLWRWLVTVALHQRQPAWGVDMTPGWSLVTLTNFFPEVVDERTIFTFPYWVWAALRSMEKDVKEMEAFESGILQALMEMEVDGSRWLMVVRQVAFRVHHDLGELYDGQQEQAWRARRAAPKWRCLWRAAAILVVYAADIVGVALVATGDYAGDEHPSFLEALAAIPGSTWICMAATWLVCTIAALHGLAVEYLRAKRMQGRNADAVAFAANLDHAVAQEIYDGAALIPGPGPDPGPGPGPANENPAANPAPAAEAAVAPANPAPAAVAAAGEAPAAVAPANPAPAAAASGENTNANAAAPATGAAGSNPGPSAGAGPSKTPASSVDIEMGGRD